MEAFLRSNVFRILRFGAIIALPITFTPSTSSIRIRSIVILALAPKISSGRLMTPPISIPCFLTPPTVSSINLNWEISTGIPTKVNKVDTLAAAAPTPTFNTGSTLSTVCSIIPDCNKTRSPPKSPISGMSLTNTSISSRLVTVIAVVFTKTSPPYSNFPACTLPLINQVTPSGCRVLLSDLKTNPPTATSSGSTRVPFT